MDRALEVAGLTRDQMATELGVHRNTIGNYLNGKTAPTRSVLIAWHFRTGVPLQWLETGDLDGGGDGGPTVTGRDTSRELHSNRDNVMRIRFAA